jgi:RNAse (barnase) inhibitor barstar
MIMYLPFKKDIETIKLRNTFKATIHGEYCTTAEKLYQVLQKSFDLPDYFGHNLDALYDCLLDLEWIVESKVVLIIEDFDELLSEEEKDPDLLEDFILLLDDVVQSWDRFDSELIEPKQFTVYIIESEKAKNIMEDNGIEFVKG